jgi:hypothetical protein
VDLNNLAAGSQTVFQAPAGLSVAALAALDDGGGRVVAALSDGSVALLRFDAATSAYQLDGFLRPQDDLPVRPDALALLDGPDGREVLVTSQGEDRLYTFSFADAGGGPGGSGGASGPQVPAAPDGPGGSGGSSGPEGPFGPEGPSGNGPVAAVGSLPLRPTLGSSPAGTDVSELTAPSSLPLALLSLVTSGPLGEPAGESGGARARGESAGPGGEPARSPRGEVSGPTGGGEDSPDDATVPDRPVESPGRALPFEPGDPLRSLERATPPGGDDAAPRPDDQPPPGPDGRAVEEAAAEAPGSRVGPGVTPARANSPSADAPTEARATPTAGDGDGPSGVTAALDEVEQAVSGWGVSLRVGPDSPGPATADPGEPPAESSSGAGHRPEARDGAVTPEGPAAVAAYLLPTLLAVGGLARLRPNAPARPRGPAPRLERAGP